MDLGEYEDEAKKALMVALEKHGSTRAADALGKLKVSEAVSPLVNLNKKFLQNMQAQRWSQPTPEILAALSQLDNHITVEAVRETLETVPLTHEFARTLKSATQTISTLPPDTPVIDILTKLLDRFCVEVGKDGQYSYLHWSAYYDESNDLVEAIRKTISFFEQADYLESRTSQTLVKTTTLLLDIVKHRRSLPQLGFDKTLVDAIQLLGQKQVQIAISLFRDTLNTSELTVDIWETTISALGRIGTEAAAIALCDVYKNREVVYRPWDHDTLCSLATKAILEIESKSTFSIFFKGLQEVDLLSLDLHEKNFLFGHVAKEVRVVKKETTLELLVQAWVDTPFSAIQNFMVDTCFVNMPECLPFIIKHAVPSPKQSIRFSALKIFNEFDTGRALDGIYLLSRGEDAEIHRAAIWILAEKQDVRAIDDLARMIETPPKIKGVEWDTSMSWVERTKNRLLLRHFLDYDMDESGFISEESIRKEAVELLIKIEDPKTDDVLQSLSANSNPAVRSWGKYGLDKIREKKKQAPYPIPPLSTLS